MSRATKLRDAVRDELATRLGRRVDSILIPDYEPEELHSGTRIFVRRGARTVEVDQGPDRRTVVIEIGFAGLLNSAEGSNTTKDLYRSQQLAEIDEYDDLLEQIIGCWSPNGPLSRCSLAEHSFEGLEETQTFDVIKVYEDSMYVPLLSLTYMDQLDE